MASNDREPLREEPWDPMHYGHPRMPLAERAKIFMPFDPLKGFRAELARRERMVAQERDDSPSVANASQ